jgi:hypothetical protein
MVSAASNIEDICLQRGEGSYEAAFHELIEAHRADLHARYHRMLGPLHDADDALQDTLLRAWRARSLGSVATARFAPGFIGSRPTSASTRSHGAPSACSRSTTAHPAHPAVGGQSGPCPGASGSSPTPTRQSASRTARRLPRPATSAARRSSWHPSPAPAPVSPPAGGAHPPRRARVLRQGSRGVARHDGPLGERGIAPGARRGRGAPAGARPAGNATGAWRPQAS